MVVNCFLSLYSINHDLGVNPGIAKMCCGVRVNNVTGKWGISQCYGKRSRFVYIDKLPDDYFINSDTNCYKTFCIKLN